VTGLSVVVACRDRAELLSGCVSAVLAELQAGDELVVVDAGSRDGEVRSVAASLGATVLRTEAVAAAAARNAGWRHATHSRVAFTDDDCRPAPGWRAAVLAALDELDVVCCRVLPEGAGHLSVLTDEVDTDYTAATPVWELGHGAGLAARRSALERVGGWDESLGPGTRWPGAEDKDLLLRVLEAGLRAGYRAAPAVRHLQWRGRRQVLRAEHAYGRGVAGLARTGRGPSTRTWLRMAATATVADLRHGYLTGTLAGLCRSAGIVRGAVARGRT